HPERRREVPAGDVDVRLRGADVGDDGRQKLGAVDEQLDAIVRARPERAARRPPSRGRAGRAMSVACQPPSVVCGDAPLHEVAEDVVEPVERERRHPGRYWPVSPIVVIGGAGGVVVAGGGGGGAGVVWVAWVVAGGAAGVGAGAAGAVDVGVVYVGVYEYEVLGGLTVRPLITGERKYSIGSFAVATVMNACQISAGSVPPVTPATPST